jgi:hypothetical protein
MRILKRFLARLKTVKFRLLPVDWRAIAAYILMFAFIIAPCIGVAMIYPPAGWIYFGAASGIVGYILGAE